MSKSSIFWIGGILIFLTGAGLWAWNRFGPSTHIAYHEVATELPVVTITDSSSHACDLVVRRYRQIGHEMQFEIAANAGGLAPYRVVITQKGKMQQFEEVPHRFGTWLTIPNLILQNGSAEIKVTSLGLQGCEVTAQFNYDGSKTNMIPPAEKWVRHGSKDNMLDVRPVLRDGKLFLQDFANYNDGRTKVVMIDGIGVNGIENGIEVKPGYLYTITARWIDAPYNDWWNELKSRTLRQQNIWIAADSRPASKSSLTKVEIPQWFAPPRRLNVTFDQRFPEFSPIQGKIVAQSRLNDYVPAENYYKRGISNLANPGKDMPVSRQHYTATPNYFADKDAEWFGKLSKQQVEELAGAPGFGVYAYDFEFWNQQYSPEVRQRLIWFTKVIRKNHPQMNLMDYWGGGAYLNPHINTMGGAKPKDLMKDYENPVANNPNFKPLENGESFQNLFNTTPIDVYPKAMFAMDEKGNTPNNFVLLSAIHSHRINRLIPYQKNNKLIFYAWNRYQPLYKDPINPWNYPLTDPKGELIMNQLEMMPASQALSLSLFSLVLFDGYYLWHEGSIYGNDPNAYKVGKDFGWTYEWYPADGKTPDTEIGRHNKGSGAPWYWDFPTEYYVLGNWMAKQVEDIIVSGKVTDLAIKPGASWIDARKEQALIAIDQHLPFVTSVVKGKNVAVLAVDSFQPPNATRTMKVRLPDGTEADIELYGNWPALYRGTLK